MSKINLEQSLISNFISLYTDKNFFVNIGADTNKTRRQVFEAKNIRSKLEAQGFHTSYLSYSDINTLNAKLVEQIGDAAAYSRIKKVLTDENFYDDFIYHLDPANQSLVQRDLRGKRPDPLAPIEELNAAEYGTGGGGAHVIRNIPQDYLRKQLLKFIGKQAGGEAGLTKTERDFLSKNIQSGHLASVFFLKFLTFFGLKANWAENPSSYRDFTLSFEKSDTSFDPDSAETKKTLNLLTVLGKAILDADFATSNNPHLTLKIMLEATRSVTSGNPHMRTQLQLTGDNGGSGAPLIKAGEKLEAISEKIIKAEANKGGYEDLITSFVKSLKPLHDLLLDTAAKLDPKLNNKKIVDEIKANAKELGEILVTSKGSLPLYKLIGKNVAGILDGKAPLTVPPTVAKVKNTKVTKKTVDVKKFAKDALKVIHTIHSETLKAQKQIKRKISVAKSNRTASRIVSLVQLQNLINDSLVDRIKQNMGKGTDRKILNLRTGRLAESVKVERMSESREGMITAFYSYMKNPYATFSKGGRQENPPSRDPKLLIARSIRDIAAQKVSNRLRSVNV
jgi:hypothetical protein